MRHLIRNLRYAALPQNDALGIHDNRYSDIIHVKAMAFQITGNISKLTTKKTSELRLTGAVLGNLAVFSGFPIAKVGNFEKNGSIYKR